MKVVNITKDAHGKIQPPEGYAWVTSGRILKGDLVFAKHGASSFWEAASLAIGADVEGCYLVVRPLHPDEPDAERNVHPPESPEGYALVTSGIIRKGDLVAMPGDSSWQRAHGAIGCRVGSYGFVVARPLGSDDGEPKPDATNPKDRHGEKKPPLGLLPAAGKIYGAMAMAHGAKKYAPYNWRDKKVRLTIYLDAIERHLLALRDGETDDAESGLPHIAHILADASIIADAAEGGFLIDDRPTPGPGAKVLEKFSKK